MPLTEFQRNVCRIIARERVVRGDSYVAGGSALNEILQAGRVSQDVDLFHDSREALLCSWEVDRRTLQAAGFVIRVQREFATFVEVEVRKGSDAVVLQWCQDSAYRFFPLVEHPDFGLSLHPFDLAVNKVLAMVGRIEARDWIDVLTCHERLQPFGYLAWSASGKDPGLNPSFILEQAARSARYTRAEIESLAFSQRPAPDAAVLSGVWRKALGEAAEIVELLPEQHVGACVADLAGHLFRGDPVALRTALGSGEVKFHHGSLRGAWPSIAS